MQTLSFTWYLQSLVEAQTIIASLLPDLWNGRLLQSTIASTEETSLHIITEIADAVYEVSPKPPIIDVTQTLTPLAQVPDIKSIASRNGKGDFNSGQRPC